MEMDISSTAEIKENAVNSNLKTEQTNSEISIEEEQLNENNKNTTGETVPYILNGELYRILARNGENVTVKCCSCPSGRFYRGSVRSTGNFHMHIKRRHPYLLGKLHEMKVHSLLERRDRLLKNRKAKLRRILVNNSTKDEHELHKLKIRRAFQRHQAEAKENEQDALSESALNSTVNENLQEIVSESIVTCDGNTTITTEQIKESSSNDEQLAAPITSNFVSSDNVFCDLRICNVQSAVKIDSPITSQQITPTVTPYASTHSDIAICEFSPLSYSESKNIHNDIMEQHPLDLSKAQHSSVHSSPSSPANDSNVSSGIGLEPMWSNTTVANTVSSIVTNVARINHNSSLECNDTAWWQQRLALILCDIRNDIRTRNQIEHNRLLLEIAKMKFLNPDFCFNIQK